jgi:hypothetical protein
MMIHLSKRLIRPIHAQTRGPGLCIRDRAELLRALPESLLPRPCPRAGMPGAASSANIGSAIVLTLEVLNLEIEANCGKQSKTGHDSLRTDHDNNDVISGIQPPKMAGCRLQYLPGPIAPEKALVVRSVQASLALLLYM